MTGFRGHFLPGLFAAWLATGAAIAADAAPPPTGQTDPPTAPALTSEQLSLQGFGLRSVNCLEWGDACSICQRDASGAMNCSTPGIACQPEAIVCRREKAR